MIEQVPGLVEQHGAHRGERDAGRRADEERGADVGLHLLDRPAQRRLTHMQPGSGPSEVEFLGDRHEVAQGS